MNVTIPPTISDMGPMLFEFFEAMIHKLHVNSHKDAIRSDDVDGLLAKMAEEIQEFRDQRIADASDPNVLAELSDISNFAFLLYAYLRSRGVMDLRERFIREFLFINAAVGKVYCAKSRSGSPLKAGDEVKGTWRAGRCYIRTQHSVSGATISVPRSDLIWWASTGSWPVGKIRYLDENKANDAFSNLCYETKEVRRGYPFVSQYRPRGRENGANYGKWVYQRRHMFELVRVGYWDTEEEAAREGILAWKARIKEKQQ